VQCCGSITDPALLFADEPTSGLDGFAALVVMRLMKKFCQRGMMIICTIHQPRPAIWSLFEKVSRPQNLNLSLLLPPPA
jgi:ATP-binding cassette, subfamily G (WHITE), member 2